MNIPDEDLWFFYGYKQAELYTPAVPVPPTGQIHQQK
jgi:hypothetical protein